MGTRAKVRKVEKIPPIVEEEREKLREKVPENIPIPQLKRSPAQ